jgi:transposase-like protein
MGYTSVRKCILIEIRAKFNLIHKKEWTGDTISNICKRYDVSRKTYYKKAYNEIREHGGINGLTTSAMFLQRLIKSDTYTKKETGKCNTCG